MLEDFLQEDFLQEAFFLVGLFVAWPYFLQFCVSLRNIAFFHFKVRRTSMNGNVRG